MGARRFSDLICWQLARDLPREVFRLTSKPAFDHDFKFRDQLRDAASSSRRNIAEGFGRASHREFARFLNVSVGSMNEVEDGLVESEDNGYLTRMEIDLALRLCKRARVATTRLRNSIKDNPDPP
jgi:four helix bundle protein